MLCCRSLSTREYVGRSGSPSALRRLSSSLAIEAAQARGWNPGRPEVGKCLRWAEELLLADPLVDEQRRNLSAQSWEAHVYPDKANLLMSTKIGVFSTLRECRGAAQRLIENEKWPAADYECGLNCQRTPGSRRCTCGL